MRLKRNKGDRSKLCKICNRSNISTPNKRITEHGFSYKNGVLTCKLGHITKETYNNLKAREYRCYNTNDYSELCPICKKQKYYTKVISHIESLGYVLVSCVNDDFNSRKTKLEIICQKGHKSVRNYEHIYTYPSCSQCKMSVRTGWYDNLKEFGIIAIEKTSACSAKIVDCGKIKNMTISQICQRWLLNPFEIYRYKKSYIVEDSERNDRVKFHTVCPNNHKFSTSQRYLLEGHGCRICSLSQISDPEYIIGEWIENAGFSTIRRDMSAIGLELDIYVPDKKIAVEYCGIRWHSLEHLQQIYSNDKFELRKNDFINQHQQKMLIARNKGIHLITIFETDFNKHRQKIREIIADALSGVLTNTVDLRYRKLLPNEKYTDPQPHYYARNLEELDDYDNSRKYYTVYDCGNLLR